MTVVINCNYIEPHQHEYPDDWEFGGASGKHPAQDPRYTATVYEYYDQDIKIIHTTVVPTCDLMAVDYFTFVANMGPDFNPIWVSARRPNRKVEMLQWIYDKATDEVDRAP